MTIIHPINSFLFEIFPEADPNSPDSLVPLIESFYTVHGVKPTVKVEKDFITVTIDTNDIQQQSAEFKRAISLCETAKFAEAKPILAGLISKNPTNSEYYRIMGQVHSMLGDPNEAVNYLIDALRWDRKNGYALIMMGNIFSRDFNDVDTAMKYYNEVLAQNPDDHLALNNIGSTLLQMDKWEQGIDFLEKAFAANPDYPNTSFGLALAWQKQGDHLTAFEYAITSHKAAQGKDRKLADYSLGIMMETAEYWVRTNAGEKVLEEYRSYLQRVGGMEIRSEASSDLPTAAKLEIAENYKRQYHLIRYKPEYPAVEHLEMHELVHLDFVIEARKEKANMLFIHGNEKLNAFFFAYERDIKKMVRDGYSEQSVANVFKSLYEGIGRQIYNTPIDLFIEDFLYENYRELRPFQFMSLQRLIGEGLQAITHKEAKRITPPEVYRVSKILNIINAIHFKDVFGIDMVTRFNPTPSEIKEANRLWEEFKEYRKDRKPAEEYELVQHWADDLGFAKYFELVDEIDFRSRTTKPEDLLEELEEDPFSTESDSNFKRRQTDTFLKKQAEIGTNMAVVMYMVDALQHFDGMPTDQIRDIAFEIAMVGTQGINPKAKEHYRIKRIPEKEFSGYHLLAYYYVSWAKAVPEMLSQLQLPYDNEYQMALTMFKPKQS